MDGNTNGRRGECRPIHRKIQIAAQRPRPDPPRKRLRVTCSESTSGNSRAPTHMLPSVPKLGLLITGGIPDPTLASIHIRDTLLFGHYRSSALTYARKQRRGIPESFAGVASPMAFLQRASAAFFPLNEPIPRPADFCEALEFAASNSSGTLHTFRAHQLGRLEVVDSPSRQQTDRWYSFTPDCIRPATGKLHVALRVHVVEFLGLSATAWFAEFVFGFLRTGVLSRRFTFPLGPNITTLPGDPESLFCGNAARFISRARRAPVRHAEALWADSMAQVQDGWLTAPRLLNSDGDFDAEPRIAMNIALRFGYHRNPDLGDLATTRTRLLTLLALFKLPSRCVVGAISMGRYTSSGVWNGSGHSGNSTTSPLTNSCPLPPRTRPMR